MLTKDEKDYLAKIPASKKAAIYPFNQKAKEIGKSVVAKIRNELPKLKVLFMGSVALGIDGQKDIDIYVLSDPKDFDKYLPTLRKLFGDPLKQGQYVGKSFIEWKYMQNDYLIEIYLTEPPEKQIKVFEILKSDKKLLKEYEDLKLSFNGKSYRDYQKAKYEFYGRMLREK